MNLLHALGDDGITTCLAANEISPLTHDNGHKEAGIHHSINPSALGQCLQYKNTQRHYLLSLLYTMIILKIGRHRNVEWTSAYPFLPVRVRHVVDSGIFPDLSTTEEQVREEAVLSEDDKVGEMSCHCCRDTNVTISYSQGPVTITARFNVERWEVVHKHISKVLLYTN